MESWAGWKSCRQSPVDSAFQWPKPGRLASQDPPSPAGENYGNTFRVEDGLLKVRYDKDKYEKYDEKFGHLFTDKSYSHYRLRVEYRFVGEQCPGGPGWAIRNSGMMLHCEDPAGMTLDQDFPRRSSINCLVAMARTREQPRICVRRH